LLIPLKLRDKHHNRKIGSKLPLAFEPNREQGDAGIDYMARGRGYSLSLTPAGATSTLQRADAEDTDVLRMNLAGASVRPSVTADRPLPGRVNYLLGNDLSRWKTELGQFGMLSRVRRTLPAVPSDS
jgi:hypothetical protein